MTGYILTGFAVWFAGLAVGVLFTGYIFYCWIRRDPGRIQEVLRWLINYLASYSSASIKIHATLVERASATKVLVYVEPEDLADGIARYALGEQPPALRASTNIPPSFPIDQKNNGAWDKD